MTDFEERGVTSLELLFRRQAELFQNHADRASELPSEIASDFRSQCQSAVNGNALGALHSRLKSILADAEDVHWRLVAEWLLAERDWKATA